MSDFTEADVEAAAQKMYEANGSFHRELNEKRGRVAPPEVERGEWGDANPYHRDLYLTRARAALTAVAPGLVARATEPLQAEVDAMVGELHELLDDCAQTGDNDAAVRVWAVREVLARYRVTTEQVDGTDWAAVARARQEMDAEVDHG